MKSFLWLYVDVGKDGRSHSANPVGGQWQHAADRAARDAQGGKSTKGDYMSRCLRHWSKAYIRDRKALPICDAPHILLRIDDENLASAVKDHLHSHGKYVCAQDLVDYSNIPENQALHGFKKGISLTTAQRWMKKLGYRWTKDPKGQYVDGHEHEDVVRYRQNVFLPAWIHYQPQMRKWMEDDITIERLMQQQQLLVAKWCMVS